MPTTTPKKGTYKVLNPHGHPKGVHIVTVDDVRYYEGDFVTAEVDKVEWLVESGYMEKAVAPIQVISPEKE